MNTTTQLAAAGAPPAAPAPAAHAFGLRLATGVLGVLLAAVMSGINGRVGALALADIRATLGAGSDEGSWITVVYTACELMAMPFSAWFSVTLSFRRFHIGVVAIFTLLGLLLPAVHSLPALIALRGVQGFFGGLLIPVLMAAALRFLPLHIRLYGLSLYALTATFSPNLATWLAASWTDRFASPSLVYLEIVPLALASMAAVSWGIPQDPVRPERFRQINLLGLMTGALGLGLLAAALGQGERLDWLNSPLIRSLFLASVPLLVVFLVSEWFHPLPFVRLQLLSRRNLGLGFTIFTAMLVVLLSGSMLPADYLAERWHFRPEHMQALGLAIGLPQLVLGPMVSALLYRKWVDARKVFALGLALMAVSCFAASRVTSDWNASNFTLLLALQAFGQPMAIVSMLFLATSVVQPMEGPFVSGIVNTLRAFGTLLGGTLIGRLLVVREQFHNNVLLGRVGQQPFTVRQYLQDHVHIPEPLAHLADTIREQAYVLAIADGYVVLGALALLLIPLVLNLHFMPAPIVPSRHR